jgi:hypothetical protein
MTFPVEFRGPGRFSTRARVIGAFLAPKLPAVSLAPSPVLKTLLAGPSLDEGPIHGQVFIL